jgi:CRISPR-associated protein Cas6
MKVDLWFPILGTTLPSDHGYALYSALSRQVPQLHGAAWWALHTVRGAKAAPGFIALSRAPRLGLRLESEHIPLVLPLAGRLLDVAGTRIRLGSPSVEGLSPHPALSARMVTIKPFVEPDPFRIAVEKQIKELGLVAAMSVGARKVLEVNGRTIVGFSVRVAGLDGPASLLLQDEGLGGRRHMGCGVFRRSLHDLAVDSRPLRAAAE